MQQYSKLLTLQLKTVRHNCYLGGTLLLQDVSENAHLNFIKL